MRIARAGTYDLATDLRGVLLQFTLTRAELEQANAEQIREAIARIRGKTGHPTRTKTPERHLRKLGRGA